MSTGSLAYTDVLFPTRQLPPLVYHYTSHETLTRIVESKSLWASNIRYMNDSRELDVAVELLRGVLQERKREAQGWQARVIALMEERYLKRFYRHSPINVYTASFSEADDLLSQWRGYCPPGAGYSLGLAPAFLRRVSILNGFTFGKCLYHPDHQRAAVAETVDLYLGRLPFFPDIPAGPDWTLEVARGMFRLFLGRAPLLKDPAFGEEHEWRLVGVPTARRRFPTIRHRAGKSMIVPYIVIPLEASGRLPLREVVIGPTDNPVLAYTSLEQFLHSKGVYPRIRRSKAPFRVL